MFDVSKCLVLSADGSVDANATADAVYEAAEAYNANRANDLDTVASAVATVFAAHPDCETLPMTFIKQHVCLAQGATPKTSGLITARVQDYIKSQEGKLFTIKKGAGVSLIKTA